MPVDTPSRVASRQVGSAAPAAPRDAQPTRSAPARLPGADVLRAVAAVAVIVIHASYWPLQDHGADDRVWGSVTVLARFAVPAFVLLTGLVLGFRYGDRRLGGAFLGRRARRSLLPWLIWAPVFCLADVFWSGQLAPSWSSVASWFSGGAGHLYFLLLVPQLYVLLLAWPQRRRPLLRLTAAAVLLQVALTAVRLYVPIPGGALHQLVLDHGFELFPFWIGWFAAGVLAGRWLASRRGRGIAAWPFLLALVPTAALLLWEQVNGDANGAYAQGTGAFLRPLLLPFALAVCAAAVLGGARLMRRGGAGARGIDVVSRHSLGVYIVHPFFLTILATQLRPALHMHVPGSILPFLAITLGSLLGALLVSTLLARTPLALTVGEERVPWRGGRRERRDADAREREILGRRVTA